MRIIFWCKKVKQFPDSGSNSIQLCFKKLYDVFHIFLTLSFNLHIAFYQKVNNKQNSLINGFTIAGVKIVVGWQLKLFQFVI